MQHVAFVFLILSLLVFAKRQKCCHISLIVKLVGVNSDAKKGARAKAEARQFMQTL